MKQINPTEGYRAGTGIVLLNPDGLVFGAKRIDNPGNAWQMPQGGLDAGETPEQGALRELREETGVDPSKVSVLAQSQEWLRYDLPTDLGGRLWKGKYRGQEQIWFLMRFEGHDADIDITAFEPEFSEWRWMSPAALVATIVPFKRDMYRRIFADFESHL